MFIIFVCIFPVIAGTYCCMKRYRDETSGIYIQYGEIKIRQTKLPTMQNIASSVWFGISHAATVFCTEIAMMFANKHLGKRSPLDTSTVYIIFAMLLLYSLFIYKKEGSTGSRNLICYSKITPAYIVIHQIIFFLLNLVCLMVNMIYS